MEIRVRFFASLADRTGTAFESIEIDPGNTVVDLWGEMVRRHPGLSQVSVRPMVACDMEYADWDRPLEGVREVAFLPPVSGG